MAKLTVAQGWKFIRPDKTHFMLWKHESYRVTVGKDKGTVGSLITVTDHPNYTTVHLKTSVDTIEVCAEDVEEYT